jgi:hypothetical protein
MDSLLRNLAEKLDRRSFLGKVTLGLAGSLLALIGVPRESKALVSYYCCTLCESPSGSCSGCACTWCWRCLSTIGRTFNCCECHKDDSYCGSGCSNVTCSWAYIVS